MTGRLRHVLPVIIGGTIFVAALLVLRHELRTVTWAVLSQDLVATPPWQLLLALVFTAASYLVLVGYDWLALATIQKRLPVRNIALASFLSYAISHSIGFAMLSSVSIRYRFYTRWGVTAEELSQIIVSYSITFWLGLCVLIGISLMVAPVPAVEGLPLSHYLPLAGRVLLVVPFAFVATTMVRRQPIRLWRFELPLPTPRIALAQVGVSVLDWALCAAVLYALLPPGTMTFSAFVGPFLAAILLGMASHVPGGLGVFDGLMVLLLQPYISSADLVPRLVVYRACYYLLPFIVALVGLTADELHQRREQAARITSRLGRLTEQLTPQLFGALVFLAGLILLLSGARPVAHGRLERLQQWLPLSVIELSHFAGSVVGTLLLILSQGLRRRLDVAYYATAVAIGVGILASLFKGLDYEEAIALAGVLAILIRARAAFDRRGAFFETSFSPVWVTSVVAAVGASVWLGLFAFKHVTYRDELWWQFALHGQASRFLRASVGAALVGLTFAVTRLVKAAPHEVVEPTEADLDTAMAIIARQSATTPNLVFLRDKGLIFNEARTTFLMYGVQGRTWVALRDPVGPEDTRTDVIRLFLERCDDFGGVPVFYEVSKQELHRYADFGLTFVKVGEEARVDLSRFALDGAGGARYRKLIRRLEKDGGTFRVVDVADVPAILPELRAVSDTWLTARIGAEKGFSLGFFDEAYMARFPVAVVTVGGRIVAFANLWCGRDRIELSVDLMRFHREAPKGAMEALFANLLCWGKAEGYRWFALGMAPLAGVERSPAASLWNRLGAFLYEHGGRVYNFQGLRAYKEKFDPVWEPRYLVYPGGMTLPRLLADVAALIAGGYRRLFRS